MGNFVDSVYEFVARGDRLSLPPAFVEAFFLALYLLYAVAHFRARGGDREPSTP